MKFHKFLLPFLFLAITSSFSSSLAQEEQCGVQAGGALCPQGYCCSNWGFCGTTEAYCGQTCQSQCPHSPPSPPPPPPPSPPPPSPPPPPPPSPPPPPPPSPPPPSPSPPPPSPSPPPPGLEQCGTLAGGKLCPQGLCCSKWGFCGTTDYYCSPENCESQCPPNTPPLPPIVFPPPLIPGPLPPTAPSEDISDLITSSMFEEMLKHRNDNDCPAKGFYTYDAFITATKSFPAFATTGDIDARKREIAAFFAQTSHETTGGWATAPDGPYSWGYCFVEEIYKGDYCVEHVLWPCVPGKQYYGRGPIQLSYNYNYGQCGEALELDLLSNPDLVASDPVVAFETALWFWMTPQSPKPSCHAVIIGEWKPTLGDQLANRYPGLGLTTNIINGGVECGHGPDPRVESRIGFYKRYCDMFGISYGDNLDCNNQTPFGWSLQSHVAAI